MIPLSNTAPRHHWTIRWSDNTWTNVNAARGFRHALRKASLSERGRKDVRMILKVDNQTGRVVRSWRWM